MIEKGLEKFYLTCTINEPLEYLIYRVDLERSNKNCFKNGT